MYSDIVNNSGLSQHTLEMMVLVTVGILIFGVIFYLYWKQIVFGSLALFGVVVFANHQPATKPVVVPTPTVEKVVEKQVEVITEKSSPVKPVEVKPETKEELLTKPEDDRKYFIEDCLSYTDHNKKQCESLWDKRETAGDIKLLDVDNVAYKKRRAEALKKPGAVVAHFTLQDRK